VSSVGAGNDKISLYFFRCSSISQPDCPVNDSLERFEPGGLCPDLIHGLFCFFGKCFENPYPVHLHQLGKIKLRHYRYDRDRRAEFFCNFNPFFNAFSDDFEPSCAIRIFFMVSLLCLILSEYMLFVFFFYLKKIKIRNSFSQKGVTMPKKDYFFTSESVTEGHPDKIADQISDAILDAILSQDPVARVACETLLTTGLAFVAGEISTTCYVHIPDIVRKTIRDIGIPVQNMGSI